MSPADEELFRHEVDVMTVGELRAALAGVPDDAHVRVEIAESPGGDTCDEQVIYRAGADPTIWYRDTRTHEPPRRPADGWFTLSAEFPPGDYYRPRKDAP